MILCSPSIVKNNSLSQEGRGGREKESGISLFPLDVGRRASFLQSSQDKEEGGKPAPCFQG